MKSYSQDLRKRVVEAVEAGKSKEVAEALVEMTELMGHIWKGRTRSLPDLLLTVAYDAVNGHQPCTPNLYQQRYTHRFGNA